MCGNRAIAAGLTLGAMGVLGGLGSLPTHERDAIAAAAPSASARKTGGKSVDSAGGRDPGCIYGKVLDGHTGEIRCLSPEEVSPPGPYDTPPPEPSDAGADAGRAAPSNTNTPGPKAAPSNTNTPGPKAAPSNTTISVEGPVFENGEVPRAAAALDRMKKDFAHCVTTEPSSLRSDAALQVRFLVRAPGRAEGVDVVQSRGVSADIVRCVTSHLSGRLVGTPSSDPVACTVTLRFKSAGGPKAAPSNEGAGGPKAAPSNDGAGGPKAAPSNDGAGGPKAAPSNEKD